MTSEQREKLKPFEKSMKMAVEAKAVQAFIGYHQMKIITSVYNEVTGSKESVKSCRKCKVELLAALSPLYFASEDEKIVGNGKKNASKAKRQAPKAGGKKPTEGGGDEQPELREAPADI